MTAFSFTYTHCQTDSSWKSNIYLTRKQLTRSFKLCLISSLSTREATVTIKSLKKSSTPLSTTTVMSLPKYLPKTKIRWNWWRKSSF